MISLLGFGFLLGMRHALEADHIATIASLLSTKSSRYQMLRQGLAWGIGHSITLLVIVSIALWMDNLIPERLAAGLEFAVGVMMILLGFDVIRRAHASRVHFHSHSHNKGPLHFHAHSHSPSELQEHNNPVSHQHQHIKDIPLRAFLLGLLHGMAGSAALVILFADQVESFAIGLTYVAIFSVGSIAGMLVFSLAISMPLLLTTKKFTSFHHYLQLFIGLLTSVIGIVICTKF